MKNIKLLSIFTLLGILLANLLTSCTANINSQTGETIEKEYLLDSFDKIMLEGAYNVELSQGDTLKMIVTTTEDHHDRLKIDNKNGALKVESNLKNITANEIKLQITFKELDELKIEGGLNLKTIGYLTFHNLDLDVEGGANMNMQLTVDKLTAKTEGGVNIDLKGRANYFKISTEGASNIDADHLQARIVNCSVTGVGNASVYATEKLDAYLEGLGKIGYRGDPKINKHVNGIGVVYKK